MFEFKLDLGTVLDFPIVIIFLIVTVTFPFIKRNGIYGIKHEVCFESEEIWHRVHLVASICMIPIDIACILILFLKDWFLKCALLFIMFIIFSVMCTLVVHFTTRKHLKEKREKERLELEEQRKIESGWR